MAGFDRIGWYALRKGPAVLVLVSMIWVGCGAADSRKAVGDTGVGGQSGDGTGGTSAVSSGGRAPAGSGGVAGQTGDAGSSMAGSSGGRENTGGSMDGVPPEDHRPLPPLWDAPVELGEAGWKGSQEPLCTSRNGILAAFDVWADSRGVFALVTDECTFVGRDLPTCPPENEARAGTSLQFNDGSGWRSLLERQSPSLTRVSGLPDGAVLLARDDCGISVLDLPAGTPECSLELPADTWSVRLFAVDSESAFAATGEHLFAYDAGIWSEIEGPSEPMNAIWADTDNLFVATDFQILRGQPGAVPPFEALPEVPVNRYDAIWGFSSEDIWFGDSGGQLIHYDGSSYRVLTASRTDPPQAIRGLWGSGAELFFHTDSEFGRIREGSAEILLSTPAPSAPDYRQVSLRALWGTSPKEVFLSIADTKFDAYACGGYFMVWFDGETFHRF